MICSGPQSTETRLSSSVPLPPQSGLVASADADTIRGDVEGEDDGDEVVCTACEGSSRVLQYEYHVLYSCSYRTPVLYFRASTLGEFTLCSPELLYGRDLHVYYPIMVLLCEHSGSWTVLLRFSMFLLCRFLLNPILAPLLEFNDRSITHS